MENLINISKKIIDNVENLDDLIDSYFDPIKDISETVEDIFSPIKAIHSLYTLNKKRRFKKFLKSYACSLNPDTFNLKNTERLKKYLRNEKNFDFLSNVIENAINSRSVFGSIILGHYAAKILSTEQVLTFKELLIIEGLRELNDYELSCFIKIFSVVDLSNMVFFEELSLKELTYIGKLTISKLIQLRWVKKDSTTYLGSSGSYNFKSTEIAEDVFYLIKNTDVYKELIDFQ